jgi:hypothetical protein
MSKNPHGLTQNEVYALLDAISSNPSHLNFQLCIDEWVKDLFSVIDSGNFYGASEYCEIHTEQIWSQFQEITQVTDIEIGNLNKMIKQRAMAEYDRYDSVLNLVKRARRRLNRINVVEYYELSKPLSDEWAYKALYEVMVEYYLVYWVSEGSHVETLVG